MSAELMKSKFVRRLSSVVNYLRTYWADFFQISAVASTGPYTQTFWEFLTTKCIFQFSFFFSFFVNMGPYGSKKTSKRYSTSNHFCIFSNFWIFFSEVLTKELFWIFDILSFFTIFDELFSKISNSPLYPMGNWKVRDTHVVTIYVNRKPYVELNGTITFDLVWPWNVKVKVTQIFVCVNMEPMRAKISKRCSTLKSLLNISKLLLNFLLSGPYKRIVLDFWNFEFTIFNNFVFEIHHCTLWRNCKVRDIHAVTIYINRKQCQMTP